MILLIRIIVPEFFQTCLLSWVQESEESLHHCVEFISDIVSHSFFYHTIKRGTAFGISQISPYHEKF